MTKNNQPEEFTEAWWAQKMMEKHTPPPEDNRRPVYRNNVLHLMNTEPFTGKIPGRDDYARQSPGSTMRKRKPSSPAPA